MPAHVLIVEDDAALREAIATVLDFGEFTISTAGDGQEALECVAQDRPDLVVSDVGMPRLDGLELCRLLKQDPDTAGVGVVLVTVRDGAGDRAAGLAAGCDAYLTKPVSPLDLIHVLRGLRPSVARGR